jgi:hypothetical protein
MSESCVSVIERREQKESKVVHSYKCERYNEGYNSKYFNKISYS